MATTATSIKLDEKTRERLEQLARRRDRTPHWVMKDALLQYLDREESRDELDTELLRRWEDYQTTGLHLTGDEVDEWLERLAKGENPPLPEPHT